jgi:C1A family cysteine protease
MRGLSGLVAFFVVTVCLGTQVPAQDDAVPSPSETQRVSKSLESEDAQMPNDLERLGKFYQERFATAPEAARSQLEAIQRKAVEENWTFQPAYTSAFGRDISKMTGLRLPPNALELAKLQNKLSNEIQSVVPKRMAPICDPQARKFNLRSMGKVSPVMDQGNCGSCWAFTAAAVIESAYLLGGGNPNVSEQHILDCALNFEGGEAGSCDGGRYMYVFNWMLQDLVTTRRVARYRAVKNASACPYSNLQYQTFNWDYVDIDHWDENQVPPIASMKQAICEHGALAVAVNATDEWFVYGGGVYNINAPADQPINHAVTLVGWDDDLGAWLIKNSWNKDWGDGGFMWIKYGTSKIGSWPAWAEVQVGAPSAEVMAISRRYNEVFKEAQPSKQ